MAFTKQTTKPKQDIELSFSSINELLYCPRKYQLRKMFKHPDSQWDSTLATSGGQAIHEYIQQRAIGVGHDEATYHFFKAFDFRAEGLEQNDQNKFYRGMEACYITAQHAHKDIGIQPSEVANVNIAGVVQPAIETAFVLRVIGQELKYNYLYRGKIDLVKYREFNNRFSAIDFKTNRDKGGDNPMFTKVHAYQFHQQLVPYGIVTAYLQALKGKDKVEEVKGNTLELLDNVPDFMVEYHDIWIDAINPTCRAYKFTKTKKDIKEWFDRLTMQIMHIEFYGDKAVWPRQHSSTGCKAYAQACKFFKVCEYEDPDGLQAMLLNGKEPKEPKHFGEAITITLEV